MPNRFNPHYIITARTAQWLIRIEAAKEKVVYLPLAPMVLVSLRETARLRSTHYSTMIEGNALTSDEVEKVIHHKGHFPGRERDEYEVKGYYAALTQVEEWVTQKTSLSEKTIKLIHALVMGGGKKKVTPTPYREGQNVIKDGNTGAIIYLPPEAPDVPHLMSSFIEWIVSHQTSDLPIPLLAAIAHYQFATIHPYYDGNGRTARLVTTYILHKGGYDLKGLFSLEEYYARNLAAYYEAISSGESHNYYMGREEADITRWIEYFLEGMAMSCEKIITHMTQAKLDGLQEQIILRRKLDPRQRKVLELFHTYATVTSKQIGELFGFKPRTSTQICSQWVKNGFLEIADSSNRGRTYKLSTEFESLVTTNLAHETKVKSPS